MSQKAVEWAWHQVALEKIANSAARLVLLNLAHLANDFGIWFVGAENLAKNCGLSKRGVLNSLQELEAIGLVLSERRKKGNRDLPTRFFLQLFVDATPHARDKPDSSAGKNAVPAEVDRAESDVAIRDNAVQVTENCVEIKSPVWGNPIPVESLRGELNSPELAASALKAAAALPGVNEVPACNVLQGIVINNTEDSIALKALVLKFGEQGVQAALFKVVSAVKNNRPFVSNIRRVLMSEIQEIDNRAENERQRADAQKNEDIVAEKNMLLADARLHFESMNLEEKKSVKERFELYVFEKNSILYNGSYRKLGFDGSTMISRFFDEWMAGEIQRPPG